MTNHEYLLAVLKNQALAADSDELATIQNKKDEIEKTLRDEFGAAPKIAYGGSKAKHTLIKASYDLDIICYFPRDEDEAGGTIEELHTSVRRCLEKKYHVQSKGAALRVLGMDNIDFHIDVVPGRFVDEGETDAFLYRPGAEKKRLKTNLKTHIEHVRTSGVREAIKLMKLWRHRQSINIKTFALELLVIDILGEKPPEGLDAQLRKVLERFRDDVEGLSIQDPANSNNDLSELLNDSTRSLLSSSASSCLAIIDAAGWDSIFGKLPKEPEESVRAAVVAGLTKAAAAYPSKPWLCLSGQ